MAIIAQQSSKLRNQWKEFIQYDTPLLGIRNEITTSWNRCKNYDIDPFGKITSKHLSPKMLNYKIKENQVYLNIIKHYSIKLYNFIKNKGYVIFYTDSEGYLLYIYGDEKIVTQFSKTIDFNVGVNWGEQCVGTTAVSLALIENKNVSFISEEKYCLVLKETGCSAIPIKDEKGELIGTLGFAVNACDKKDDLFSMLLLTSEAIQCEIKNYKQKEEKEMLNNVLHTVLDSVSEGIIQTDCNGNLLNINKTAEEMLLLQDKKIIGKNISDVIDFNENYIEDIIKNSQIKRERIYVTPKIIVNVLHKENKKINHKNNVNNKYTAKYTFNDIIGKSKEILKVKNIALLSAPTDANILIAGNTGVGKELFAQAIHNESAYKFGPFIPMNCGAIPKDLIESELFGYEDGSFTGAKTGGKIGKFELASNGTIFLDEVGEMPLDMQVKLLRVLQEKQLTRIGGNKPITVNSRIIAATNKDLTKEIQKGTFRADLYWRLNVVNIKIPDLNNRKEDIQLLIKYILNKLNSNLKIHPNSLKILEKHDWPGNIRELKNTLERASIFAKENVILPEHLPEYIVENRQALTAVTSLPLNELEKSVILTTLEKNNWNILKTSKALHISRNTLYSKMSKYDIR